MTRTIRDAAVEDAIAISELVQSSLRAHIAPDWEADARHSLLTETSAAKIVTLISQSSVVLVCEEESHILGVIVLPRPNFLRLCFVASEHLRKGIGRALWEAARERLELRFPEAKTVELNSSPYAVAAYKALGFYPISEQFRRQGSVATRMACWLPARALKPAKNEA